MRDWALARAAEWTKEMPEDQLAVYTLTAIEGKASPAAPPDGYVEKLFDYAADAYNRNLQELSYQGPDLVTDMISRYFPAHGLDILDAGCGTGLNAVALKPYARTLTGIDLSSKMLEAARSRGSYDNLYKSDVVSFLKEHPSAYDLIAASDVFCYFGDLRDVIDAMAHSLRADGRIVFTVEHEKSISGTGWRLHPSGRYRHAEAYVREKLKDAGLTEVSVETRILRQELLRNVECLVVLARKES
jgi:predicted TPR repeat methyltransferase